MLEELTEPAPDDLVVVEQEHTGRHLAQSAAVLDGRAVRLPVWPASMRDPGASASSWTPSWWSAPIST